MRSLTGPLIILSNPNMATTQLRPPPRIRHPLVDGSAPEWASGWGQDAFGVFAEFSLPASGGQWVTQRMRWIPPGTFFMGSPEDEPGRFSREGPQHRVTITSALWMFDTPCTQALWQAVMGDNPSRFVDPLRPVEQVSWNDVGAFLAKLNAAVPGLALRLPTEAEWEYTCRAGINEATYAGAIKILGKNNAPILDAIAWYGGNSGVDFDLDNGWDSSGWPEKPYDHKMAGTRKVAEKLPNRWGLFDMLGNVWEWCQNWYGEYPGDAQINPQGPESGHDRVLRGGGWNNSARYVRSAYRDGDEPGYRDGIIGFRCAQVQAG
jgi:sulfatase modifying factor 1